IGKAGIVDLAGAALAGGTVRPVAWTRKISKTSCCAGYGRARTRLSGAIGPTAPRCGRLVAGRCRPCRRAPVIPGAPHGPGVGRPTGRYGPNDQATAVGAARLSGVLPFDDRADGASRRRGCHLAVAEAHQNLRVALEAEDRRQPPAQ